MSFIVSSLNSNLEKHFYEFNGFRLDATDKLLLRGNEVVPLPPKALDLLLILVEQSGRVLMKEELIERLWPDSYVEEANLSHNIFLLRKALGERQSPHARKSADGESELRFIETLARRGYRFVAPVTEWRAAGESANGYRNPPPASIETTLEPGTDVDEAPAEIARPTTGAAPVTQLTRQPTATLSLPRRLAQRLAQPVVALTSLVLVAAGGVYFGQRFFGPAQDRASAPRVVQLKPLTSNSRAGNATISPDGKFIAYAAGIGADNTIWLQQTVDNSTMQLVPPQDAIIGMAEFSHDGAFLYYVLWSKAEPAGSLYRVPTLGGLSQRLLTGLKSLIALSPDEQQVAFVRGDKPGGESSLIIARLDSQSKPDRERVLLSRHGDGWVGCVSPAWSPDGKQIACGEGVTLADGKSFSNLVSIDTATGAVTKLTEDRINDIGRIYWLKDGHGLVLVALQVNSGSQVYYLPAPQGHLQRVTNDLNFYNLWSLGVTADGHTLIAAQYTRTARLWQTSPNGNDAASDARLKPLTSGLSDGRRGLCYLPDGSIAYIARTGVKTDIWLLKPDGSRQQLTDDNFVEEGLAASPDGRYLVFSSDRSGQSHLWRIHADGSAPEQLTDSNALDYEPAITPDGQWVVYVSMRNDKTSLYKVPLEGSAPVLPVLVAENAKHPNISPDGSLISAIGDDPAAMRKSRAVVLPFGGGEPVRTFALSSTFEAHRSSYQWAPDGRSLIYFDQPNNVSNLWRQPLDGGAPYCLTDFKTDLIYQFAFAPNGRDLVLSRGTNSIDVVAISNFR